MRSAIVSSVEKDVAEADGGESISGIEEAADVEKNGLCCCRHFYRSKLGHDSIRCTGVLQ